MHTRDTGQHSQFLRCRCLDQLCGCCYIFRWLYNCLQFSVCNKGRLCSIYFCDLVTPLASGRPIFGSPDLRPHIHIPQHSLLFLTHFYFHLLIHMVSYSNSTPLKPLVYGCCCCSFCCCYCSRKSFIVINLIKICIYLWNSMSALMALI